MPYNLLKMFLSLKIPMKNPPHPGELLREDVINDLGLSEAEVAKMLGVSQQEIALVINTKRPITPDLAFKLEAAGWSTAKSWLQMQKNYDQGSMCSAETIESMKEARKGGLKSFVTVDDLMADLNADD